MEIVVTGAAGFIGSHTVEALLKAGNSVIGVDCFVPLYPRETKARNLRSCLKNDRFSFFEIDLRCGEIGPIVSGADAVIHLAAQPGVRASWGTGFEHYASHNVLATQRLLEACVGTGIHRFVYASSSSVYGNATRYPVRTDDVPRPFSPYGVTKLAGEHLSSAYALNFGLHSIALRYFTVYGPRQRPDMAINRLIRAALNGETFQLYGDGRQIREFTYVEDVVRANIAALQADCEAGFVVNISSGQESSMNQVIALVADAVDRVVNVVRVPAVSGDVRRTGGDISNAEEVLGWSATTSLETGIMQQLAWQRQNSARDEA
jgi:nucleoside-diphosphate-sugar epimerase